MSSLFLVGHTGSVNRGCEAIIRSTVELFNNAGIENIYVASDNIIDDRKVYLDRYCNIIPNNNPISLKKIVAKGLDKVFKKKEPNEYLHYKDVFKKVKNGDIVLIVGGDTYCYSRPVSCYVAHKMAKKRGAKTVFWGCSIEEDLITDEMLRDLKRYDLICVREISSYDTLINNGIQPEKVIRISDPAFHLPVAYTSYPRILDEKNTVGINISPIIFENKNMKEYFIDLMRYIISDTNFNILLIPHVYKDGKEDSRVIDDIYNEFENEERINVISDCLSCTQIKYIISKCRLFIGARTHSTIAAYSSGVPTLVVGYSVKSRGIATDLFGKYDGYTIMYDKITKSDELINAFKNIAENETQIREILEKNLPDYKKMTVEAVDKIKNMGSWNLEKSVFTDKINCSGCGACYEICPVKCITMKKDNEGFLYPEVNSKECINCRRCESVCHYKNKPQTKQIDNVYAVYSKDKNVLNNSSSGGVFYHLAKEILKQDGVVFGACFNENFKVVHSYTNNEAELSRFMGSKYVQSDVGNSFNQVKVFLNNGKKVLFSGTPCQINGLISYLGKDYENLITLDFICHGVPSPDAWSKYLEEIKKKYNSQIKSISFRDKTYGWKVFSMKIVFENGEEYIRKVNEDEYLRHFLTDISLRQSCNSCNAKGIKRASDITVADFWGIENVKILNDDDNGVSVLITRSKKAEELFALIKNELVFKESDIETVIKLNPSIINSVCMNSLRERFFKTLNKNGFYSAYEKYCSLKIGAKIRRKLKR